VQRITCLRACPTCSTWRDGPTVEDCISAVAVVSLVDRSQAMHTRGQNERDHQKGVSMERQNDTEAGR